MKCSLEIILSLSLLCMEADVAHSAQQKASMNIKLDYTTAQDDRYRLCSDASHVLPLQL